METVGYQIRRKGTAYYSNGIITDNSWRSNSSPPSVRWATNKGKTWTSEKLVKDHLLKYLKKGGDIADWEVVQVKRETTKPIQEWVDPAMLMKYLKAA